MGGKGGVGAGHIGVLIGARVTGGFGHLPTEAASHLLVLDAVCWNILQRMGGKHKARQDKTRWVCWHRRWSNDACKVGVSGWLDTVAGSGERQCVW